MIRIDAHYGGRQRTTVGDWSIHGCVDIYVGQCVAARCGGIIYTQDGAQRKVITVYATTVDYNNAQDCGRQRTTVGDWSIHAVDDWSIHTGWWWWGRGGVVLVDGD